MNEPAELQAWLVPLLARIQPSQMRRLARSVATDVRARQSKRIGAQRNPDGTAYEPRRNRVRRAHHGTGEQRSERERIKAMFSKMRTSAHLKTRHSPQGAAVQIEGRSARIAQVHQHGLLDRVQPAGTVIRFPVRQLLGWADQDLVALNQQILDYLGDRDLP